MFDAEIHWMLQTDWGLSPGDISVLEGALRSGAGTKMITSPNSANDRFWTEMVEFGWLDREERASDLGKEQNFNTLWFTVKEEGIEPIGRTIHIIKMTGLYNEMVRSVPKFIIEKVLGAGGKTQDMMAIIEGILLNTLATRFKLEDLESVLDQFYNSAKRRLNNEKKRKNKNS